METEKMKKSNGALKIINVNKNGQENKVSSGISGAMLHWLSATSSEGKRTLEHQVSHALCSLMCRNLEQINVTAMTLSYSGTFECRHAKPSIFFFLKKEIITLENCNIPGI